MNVSLSFICNLFVSYQVVYKYREIFIYFRSFEIIGVIFNPGFQHGILNQYSLHYNQLFSVQY